MASIKGTQIRKVVVACDAGMGSSVMLASQLRKQLSGQGVTVEHTSVHEIGQIYVPQVNWALMFATVFIVIGFGSSSSLASAYGIAVTLTMVITAVLLAVTIIGIPFAWAHLKLAGIALWPIGKIIVPTG